MSETRMGTAIARRATGAALAACWVLGAGLALADKVQMVSYGVVDARRPVEIKGGLFGMSKSPGMSYTIALTDTSNRIEVDSKNVSFLVGDCVAVEGEGDKTKLSRAQSQLCHAAGSKSSGGLLAPPSSGLASHGPDSQACKDARAESSDWPVGRGRNRALLRELLVCDHTGAAPQSAVESRGQPCAKAWAEVETLPFGPERAAARLRARTACGL